MRLLFSSIHCYLDPSSGAALYTRELLELLAGRGTGFGPGASLRSAPATQASFPIMGYNESRWSSVRTLSFSFVLLLGFGFDLVDPLDARRHDIGHRQRFHRPPDAGQRGNLLPGLFAQTNGRHVVHWFRYPRRTGATEASPPRRSDRQPAPG